MLLNGRAPLSGEIIKLPNLARTFRELGEKGKEGFYKGRVAQAIVDIIQSQGGVMELEDLAEHSTSFVEPISYTYANEVTVYEVRTQLSGNVKGRQLLIHSVLQMAKVRIHDTCPDHLSNLVLRYHCAHCSRCPRANAGAGFDQKSAGTGT
jgi:gamma-glutamyltranspeptidase